MGRSEKSANQATISNARGYKKEELQQEYPQGIPREYDPDLSRHQVVFFDEMHVDQEGGPAYRSRYQIRFPRDAEGRYCPQSPSNPEPMYHPIRKKHSFKFTQQARFCLGCAAVEMENGQIIGKRSYVFDYTGQRLVSISEYDRRVRSEIQRVKQLTINGNRSKWITNGNKTKDFYENDSISRLPRVGKMGKTYEAMIEHGIIRYLT